MKKSLVSMLALSFVLFTAQSCRKKCDHDVSVTKVIYVSLQANQPYSTEVAITGDADDVMQITQQASHYTTSKIDAVSGSDMISFDYTPALNYSGTDEVLITNVEGSHGNCNGGPPHNGNCNGGRHDHGSTVYDFKITVAGVATKTTKD